MKKIISRAASLLLVLVLMLSVLPVAAFASEAEEEVAPAAACTHPIKTAVRTSRCVDCGGSHRIDDITQYTCTTCHYTYSTTQSSRYEAHNFSKTLSGQDPDTGAIIYKYHCGTCGHTQYGT